MLIMVLNSYIVASGLSPFFFAAVTNRKFNRKNYGSEL